jgi:hypothetical protein
MNLQQYANHRKANNLRGQSHVAVLNAINQGRLHPPAVTRNGSRWNINPELADAQWADNTDASERGAMGIGPAKQRDPNQPRLQSRPRGSAAQPEQPAIKGAPPTAVSKQIKTAYEAKLLELEYKERNNETGSIAEMRREAFTLGKAVREGVLGVVARVSADLAAMTDQLEVERRLEEELTVALRSLADG